jgi:hypothetical protein
MPLSAQSMKNFPLLWIAGGGVLSALVVALAVPNLLRPKLSAQDSRFFGIARNAAIAAEADNSNRRTVQTGSMQLMAQKIRLNARTESASSLRAWAVFW